MAQLFWRFSDFSGAKQPNFTLFIQKPRMNVTLIICSRLLTVNESNFSEFFSTALFSLNLFLRNTATKNVYTQQKSVWLIFSRFFDATFVRIFSKKNTFLLSSTKSGYTQTQNGNEIVFEYAFLSDVHTDEEKLLLLIAFNSRHRSTFPWSRFPLILHPPARQFYNQRLELHMRSVFRESWRPPTQTKSSDMLLNIFWLWLL